MPQPLNENEVQPCISDGISSDCIPWNGANVPCINICQGDSIQDVVEKEGNLLCQIVNDLNKLENPPTPPVIDFSQLDLGCLWSNFTTNCTCVQGLRFVADPTAPGGNGYCYDVTFRTMVQPNCSTNANPASSKPNTLLGILQLIINKIPCCDPCK